MSQATRCPTRVERVFAGAYGDTNVGALAAAVASAGPVVTVTAGDLAVAWTGPPAPALPSHHRGCLLDGEIFNLEVIAEFARVPAYAAPEAILAAAYARLGEELLPRLRGEFTLLLWDTHMRRGLVARDQLGSGGLFVHADGGRLWFASELPYLLRALPRTPAPDRDCLVGLLAEGAVPPDRTLYEGVVRLPPASLLRLRDGHWETVSYWSPRFVQPRELDREQAADDLRGAVISSVGRRLRGRRAAGVLVSGGLDSGSVLAAAAQAAAATETCLRAYSAVFPSHPSMDESELIAVQVNHHGIAGLSLPVSGGSPLEGSLRYLDRWRAPLMVPGHFLWEPLLQSAAREGVECVLDGEAGDELFGVAALLMADRLAGGRAFAAARLARAFPGAGPSPSLRFVSSLLRDYSLVPLLSPKLGRLDTARRATPRWIARTEARRYTQSRDPAPWRALDGPRWWAQLADAVFRAPDRIGFFEYFRRRSRSAGMPAHHAFLDLDLIDAVLSMPPEHSFDPNLNRPLLRTAMQGLVPEPVRLRPGKSHFNPLIIDCLTANDRNLITRLLTGTNVEVLALTDPASVRTLLEGGPTAHPRGAGAWMLDVWRLATAECWLRQQSDPGFSKMLLETLPERQSGRAAWRSADAPRATRSYVSRP